MELTVNDIIALGGMLGATLGLKELLMWFVNRFFSRHSEGKRLDALASSAEAESKSAEAESIGKFAAEWKELYAKEEQKTHEKDLKIDQLYEVISKYRDTENALRKEIMQLEIKCIRLEYDKCLVSNCAKRQPPRNEVMVVDKNKD